MSLDLLGPDGKDLVRAVIANRHDDTPRLVFADYLDDNEQTVPCPICSDWSEDTYLRNTAAGIHAGCDRRVSNGYAAWAELIRLQIAAAAAPPEPSRDCPNCLGLGTTTSQAYIRPCAQCGPYRLSCQELELWSDRGVGRLVNRLFPLPVDFGPANSIALADNLFRLSGPASRGLRMEQGFPGHLYYEAELFPPILSWPDPPHFARDFPITKIHLTDRNPAWFREGPDGVENVYIWERNMGYRSEREFANWRPVFSQGDATIPYLLFDRLTGGRPGGYFPVLGVLSDRRYPTNADARSDLDAAAYKLWEEAVDALP